MKKVGVILLRKDSKIEKIRKKYLPDYKKYLPHLTLVYPFEAQKELEEEIEEIIRKTCKFKISLEGLKKSRKEYYLYLLVNEGKSELDLLISRLNRLLKRKMLYPPHLTLGVFKDKQCIKEAVQRISLEQLKFSQMADKVQIATLNNKDKIIIIKEIYLKRNF